MAFVNRVRLPFFLSKPQFPAEEEVYVKANGTRLVLSSILSKEYEGKTDWMPEQIHERLAIALRHDTVNVEGYKINAGIRINTPYEIAWQEFLNYPLAQATFRAFQEAYVARNTKCQICEPEYSGLEAVDDHIPGILDYGVVYYYDASANDTFCCDAPAFTLLSVNEDIAQSLSIDPNTGVITFELKDVTGANLLLCTYQLCCGDSCDTATVYVTVQGSVGDLCPPPENLTFEFGYTILFGEIIVNALARWDATVPPPGLYYEYSFYKIVSGNPQLINTGTTSDVFVQLGEVDCETDYLFEVRAVCSESASSSLLSGTFQIPCTGAPTRVMMVLVKAVSTPNGYNLDWTVEASIIDPAAVTADENIVVTGKILISDDVSSTGLPFTVTILAGNSSGTTAVLGSTTGVGVGSAYYAVPAPVQVTGSDANEYAVTILLLV